MQDKLSVRQIQALTALYLFGTAAITLPNIAVSAAGHTGWLGVVAAAVAACAGCYLMVSLAIIFPGRSFSEIACKVLSRPIGKLICLLIALKILLLAALRLRFFCEIITTALLPQQHFAVIGLVMLLLGAMTARYGIEATGRIAEILVFAVFLPLTFLILTIISGARFDNLLPFAIDSATFAKASTETGYAFSGIEFILLAAPFLGTAANSARKRIVGAVAFMGLLLAGLTALAVARLGAAEVSGSETPLLELFYTAGIPGAFMERHNALVISFWIITVFIMLGLTLYFAPLLLRDTFGAGKRRGYLAAVLPILFILLILPDSSKQAREWAALLYKYTDVAFVLLIPFVLVIVTHIRKKSG